MSSSMLLCENGSFSYHLYVLGGDRKVFPLDTGLRDACVESGVIADGSAAGILEGCSYNRAIWFHEIMFEALDPLAWHGFQWWIEEHHEDKNLVWMSLSKD